MLTPAGPPLCGHAKLSCGPRLYSFFDVTHVTQLNTSLACVNECAGHEMRMKCKHRGRHLLAEARWRKHSRNNVWSSQTSRTGATLSAASAARSCPCYGSACLSRAVGHRR